MRLPPLPLPMSDGKGVMAPVPEPPQQWFLALGPLDKTVFDTVLDRLLVARDTDVTIYALEPGEERWRDVAQIVDEAFLDPPRVHVGEDETRGMAASSSDATSNGPSQVAPPPLPPALPPLGPSALRASGMHRSSVATKRRDEPTPTQPVPLNRLVDSKAFSSLSPDDPTIPVEVPSPHAEHESLAHALADLDIDDVAFPRPSQAVTLPPPALDDETRRSSACPEEAAERLGEREQDEHLEPHGDPDGELVAPRAMPSPPSVVGPIWVESQAETQRESEPSINFLLNPEGQGTRDREQSTSASTAIQPIPGLDLEQRMPGARGENNKRSQARYRIATSVGLASEHNFWTGLTQDLSTGGIFVATYANLPLGANIVLSLSLPDGGPKLEAKAEVRWLRVMREDPEQWPGVGLRFLELSPAAKKRIERCLKMRDAMLFEE
jgi:uncharacterized protein (TIGR02266 family)